MPVIRLPFEQIKLFRAFVRAEYLLYEARAEARRWPLSYTPPVFLAAGCVWRIWRKSIELGLPYRTMRRAVDAELDTIGAPEDIGGGGRAS